MHPAIAPPATGAIRNGSGPLFQYAEPTPKWNHGEGFAADPAQDADYGGWFNNDDGSNVTLDDVHAPLGWQSWTWTDPLHNGSGVPMARLVGLRPAGLGLPSVSDHPLYGDSVGGDPASGIPRCSPYPLRREDIARTRLLQMRVQEVGLEVFEALAANDILFVDSSHVCKTGSDVHHILFEILPRLQSGVWVHFHDIFENFEYMRSWVFEGRAWNESYFLRAFLTNNPEWTIEIHGATLATAAGHQLLPLMPKVGQNVGGSIWLKKR